MAKKENETTFLLRIDKKLKKEIEVEASKQRLSLNSYILNSIDTAKSK